MKAKGGSWTFDELNKFLAGPRNYIPGTKMTFAGLSSENQRADIIAYLRTLSAASADSAQYNGGTGRFQAQRTSARAEKGKLTPAIPRR
jgi:hypothetical protein